jgi:predicted MFS family arabinose efflux permease
MALRVRVPLLIAEFMPVSLLTPVVNDLGATQGMAGRRLSFVHQLDNPVK